MIVDGKTEARIRTIAKQQAAQLLAGFALYLKTICESHPDTPMTAQDIDRALGQVCLPILKPDNRKNSP